MPADTSYRQRRLCLCAVAAPPLPSSDDRNAVETDRDIVSCCQHAPSAKDKRVDVSILTHSTFLGGSSREGNT